MRATERRVRPWLGVACLLVGSGAAAQSRQEPGEVEIHVPDFYAPEASLRDYVAEALGSHPGIQEALGRYRAALERMPQVESLPDPMFSFAQAIRSAETRVGPQINTFTLSQSFPWFGKLDLRGKVALQEALALHQLVLARQREVIAATKRAYYERAYVEVATGITREEQSLLEHYEALAQSRYATGQGLQQAVLKLQAELTQILNRLGILDQQRRSVEARLNTLRDRPPQDPIPPVTPPSLPDVALDLDSLYQLGVDHRQELKASEERIEKGERAIDLARRNSWPDFFIGVGFVNVGIRSDPAGVAMPPPDNGKNVLNVSAGINVPIWRDKYDAAVREAAETLFAERSQYTSLRNEMEFSIRDQAVRIETLREQIRLFETALIPQSEEALRSTEAAYETGQVSVLDLLDSERMLLGARLLNARYSADFLIALAELERAVGTSFPR